ncbi:MAG TPA: hypothetical protein VK302_07905 [Terriglobales bacterium]|nr:hypothetical protein [Terriglobales bacterium]
MIRRVFTGLLQLLLLLATSNSQTTPAQSPAHQQKTLPPKPELRANWTDELEVGYGIAKQAFHDMGLEKLTPSQLVNLLIWVDERQRQAKAAVPATTFDCGRQGESFLDAKPESYDKVRVYVDASGDATEIISGVRERLRSMNGSEVVYSSDEADLKVSLIAMQTQSKGGYDTGSAISVVVSRPCVWTSSTNTSHVDSVENQLVQVGADVRAMVDSIVSNIDTNDLDPQRKLNAQLKKMLLPRPNK